MIAKRITLLAIALAVSTMALAACATEPAEVVQEIEVTRVVTETVVEEGETVEVTRVVTEEIVVEVPADEEESMPLVTNDGYATTDIPTLDPQIAEDGVSGTYIKNLFVTLNTLDLETAEIVPDTASGWEVSQDGLTYTFNLRTDIPWVKHNPVTDETRQEVDEGGNPRFVTAQDFVYGIRRACDPNIASYYGTVVAPLVKGCSDVLSVEDPENIPQELIDAIGVSAPDDATLVIELAYPASYFLSMTSMSTLAAVPSWAIEEHGEEWIEAGNIVTNGRYVLHEWVHNVRTIVKRNPLMPEDMVGEGNIEQFVTYVVPDINTGYALWLNNEVESSRIPPAELQAHLEQFGDETIQIPSLGVRYIGFRMTKPPFDDVHVRRAFAAAFDRETFVQQVQQGQGLPMRHFAPPGIFGAPPIDEIGVGFDPEFAAAELAEAGYPNCEGFPAVTLLGFGVQAVRTWMEFAQANWSENLGCDPSLITLEQLPFVELLAAVAADTPDSVAPHMWTAGWTADYPDQNNWVGDVLWCKTGNSFKRTCNEIDDLIIEAREEQELDRRVASYAQIEEAFFGYEGETPFIPLFQLIEFEAEHSWLDRIHAPFGLPEWYTWSIDQAAKLAARGE